MWYLLSLVSTLVKLLLEFSIEFSLLVGLTGRIALVFQIAFDLFVVCSLRSSLLRGNILLRCQTKTSQKMNEISVSKSGR